MFPVHSVRSLLTITLLGHLITASAAEVSVKTLASTTDPYFGTTLDTDNRTSHNESINADAYTYGSASIANAYSYAEFGKVSASGSGISHIRNSSTAIASAKFTDAITLHSSGTEGMQGFLTVAYYYDWSNRQEYTGGGKSVGDITITGYAGDYFSTVKSHSEAISHTKYWVYGASSYSASGSTNQTLIDEPSPWIFVTTNFTWGTPINIGLEASVRGYSDSGTSTHAVDAIMGSWAGITLATTEGASITDFNVVSQSGTSYTGYLPPVPEPSTYAMLLGGLGILGFAVRRRKT